MTASLVIICTISSFLLVAHDYKVHRYMETLIFVILFFLLLAVLVAVAAISERKSVRISSAIIAFGLACLMFVAASWVESLNQNARYSSAASEMLNACIVGLEQGREEVVLGEMKKMSSELKVTYEYRVNFKELAEQMVENLQVEPVVETGSVLENAEDMKTKIYEITHTPEKFTRILWQRSYPEEYKELIVRYKEKDVFGEPAEISEDELTPGHYGLLGWDRALILRAFEELGYPLIHGAKADYDAEQNRLTITHSIQAQDAFRQRFPEFVTEAGE